MINEHSKAKVTIAQTFKKMANSYNCRKELQDILFRRIIRFILYTVLKLLFILVNKPTLN